MVLFEWGQQQRLPRQQLGRHALGRAALEPVSVVAAACDYQKGVSALETWLHQRRLLVGVGLF